MPADWKTAFSLERALFLLKERSVVFPKRSFPVNRFILSLGLPYCEEIGMNSWGNLDEADTRRLFPQAWRPLFPFSLRDPFFWLRDLLAGEGLPLNDLSK